jgi:hypothetical protein
MVTLDSCTAFCTSLSSTLGPQVTEWIAIAGVLALGWWKARKVQAAASAGIAVANEQASKAKAEARSAHVQLAEIRGSLRPMGNLATPVPPPSIVGASSSTSSSGTSFEPVIMPELGDGVPRPRPSMADPSLTSDEARLPLPAAVPSFDRHTPAERPSSKGK